MADTARCTPKIPSIEAWKDMLEELLPRQGEWSEEEYLVLTDHGNRLVEYTDGFVEPLPMPTDEHQNVLQFLFLALFQFVQPRGGKVHFAPLRLQIRPGKYREPDLLMLLSAADPRRQNRFWHGADLALEVVSEDKPERDLEKPHALDQSLGHDPHVSPRQTNRATLIFRPVARHNGIEQFGRSPNQILS
jgi:hypothetical protein